MLCVQRCAGTEERYGMAARATLLERRQALSRRRARLETARRASAAEDRALRRAGDEIETLKRTREEQKGALYDRRASLLRSLEIIYPIDLLSACDLLFSICRIPLSNDAALESSSIAKTTKEQQLQDDDTCSSALGHVAQLVILLAHYLNVPNHYVIATAGSRAVIKDPISVMTGPRTFPLYAKGVEHYRYEYAVFLLNKDVEQLMNLNKITVLDIRHTLANLKNLLVTLTAQRSRPIRVSLCAFVACRRTPDAIAYARRLARR
ncbi:hypothetical protein IE81DRAFT_96722 [Ceraceosorus guamensis]|uniref:Autophagy-related protein 14 n=1 Tax=Ceraceosorus guamensis TaxID=1522189 RepID=A0A316VMY9_9BASI|nr:hypothetical protein IE81DRAFT_96722 [Ceraceosorus guamensis]PWN38680.1 hypothetical protein IE81DRAFT_96722 [Ceraceosorus guamensis]